jgi:replicative DNA helicase
MTKIELITDFFLRACEAKEKNPAALADVLKTFSSEQRKEIADAVETFCKETGINSQDPAISEVTNLSESNKFQKRKEIVKDILKTADELLDKTPPKELKVVELQKALGLAFAEIDIFEEASAIYNLEQHNQDCRNSVDSKEFCLELFGGVRFPNGTVSYIGARTGRGKTSALVNIAREALFGKDEEARKVVFITLEMSNREILNKLILSTAYNDEGESLLKHTSYPNREIDSIIISGADEQSKNNNDKYKDFCIKVIAARDKIYKAMKEGKFVLFDGRGKNESTIMNFINVTGQSDSDTVALVDYVQKIPAKERTDQETYRRVQAVSDDLLNAAAKTNAIIIAAAQFVRTGSANAAKRDEFSEESYRECGGLEQDAHNAIGIGWEEDKKDRFFKILKTRDDDKQGDEYNIEFVGGYSHMKRGEKIETKKGNGRIGKTNEKGDDYILPPPKAKK